jgi:hypothetical protein
LNTTRAESFEEVEERHRDEWELVHGGYGVEKLPSPLEQRHAEERAAWAWQQPAFNRETMAVDPWTAVYLPIPDQNQPGVYWWNEKDTLQQARETARELQMATDGLPNDPGGWYDKWASGPSVNGDGYTREQNQAAARARHGDLEIRLEIIAARDAPPVLDDPVIMTMAEAIRRDPWNAVLLDMPARDDAELLGLILETAQDLRIHAEERAAAATSIEETEYWYELGFKADQRFDNAYVKFHEATEIVSEARTAPEATSASIEPEQRTRHGHGSAAAAGSEEFTRSDIERNPWAAVEKAIPADADDELLARARLAVEYCVATAEHDMLGPGGSVFLVEHIEKRFYEAKERLTELTELAALPRFEVHFADQSNDEMKRSGIDVGETIDRDERIYDGYPDLTRDDGEIEQDRGRSR